MARTGKYCDRWRILRAPSSPWRHGPRLRAPVHRRDKAGAVDELWRVPGEARAAHGSADSGAHGVELQPRYRAVEQRLRLSRRRHWMEPAVAWPAARRTGLAAR